MFNNIEDAMMKSLRQGLIDRSKEIIDKKVEEFRLDLHDKAMAEIDNIMSSVYVSSFDNAHELTREIHIGFKERIKVWPFRRIKYMPYYRNHKEVYIMNKEVVIKTTVGAIGVLGLAVIVKQKISNKIWKSMSAASMFVAEATIKDNTRLREELKELKSTPKVEVEEV